MLGNRKDWLNEMGVAPSVAVTIASAPPRGRERALAEIEAGRRFTAADAKMLVRVVAEQSAPHFPGLKPLERAARAFCVRVVAEAHRILDAASRTGDTDEATLNELAASARNLLPFVAMIDRGDSKAGPADVREFVAALGALAYADGPDGFRSTAAALVRTAGLAVPDTARGAEAEAAPVNVNPEPTRESTSRSGISSVSSTFKHGLTAFEICAGGGGQAAGLAKAGFRHVGLLEREKQPRETLRAAFGPEHVIEVSLVGYEPGDVEPVDLLAGGVPCQPFSPAGEQKGEHDDRDLFPEALRLVKRLRPRAVML